MYEKYLEQLEEAGKIRNLKERSINCYKNYVSYFLKYQGKNPEELTCQDVRTFLLAKKEEGLKATTLNLYNSAIRFFYRNVLHILWDDITVPRMILEHKLPTVLTSDDKIRPAGGRLFRQSLCGLYPWLQILLRLVYEAIYRAHRTVGYIPGCETLASNQKSAKIQRAARSHRFSDRWLSAPGGSVSEHPKAS